MLTKVINNRGEEVLIKVDDFKLVFNGDVEVANKSEKTPTSILKEYTAVWGFDDYEGATLAKSYKLIQSLRNPIKVNIKVLHSKRNWWTKGEYVINTNKLLEKNESYTIDIDGRLIEWAPSSGTNWCEHKGMYIQSVLEYEASIPEYKFIDKK